MWPADGPLVPGHQCQGGSGPGGPSSPSSRAWLHTGLRWAAVPAGGPRQSGRVAPSCAQSHCLPPPVTAEITPPSLCLQVCSWEHSLPPQPSGTVSGHQGTSMLPKQLPTSRTQAKTPTSGDRYTETCKHRGQRGRKEMMVPSRKPRGHARRRPWYFLQLTIGLTFFRAKAERKYEQVCNWGVVRGHLRAPCGDGRVPRALV